MKKIYAVIILCLFVVSGTLTAYAQSFSEILDDVVKVYDGVVSEGSTKEKFFQKRNGMPEEMTFVKPFEVQGEIQIFVSDTASDFGDGTIENPFKTVEQALKFYERLDYSQRKKGVVIYCREGEYSFDSTLMLNGKMSGTDEAPLYISSYNGEKVIFTTSKSIRLGEFSAVTDESKLSRLYPEARDKVLVYDLKANGITEYGSVQYDDDPEYAQTLNETEVFWEDELMTLARYPNNEMLLIGEAVDVGSQDIYRGFEWTMADDRAFNWVNTGEISVYAYFSYNYNPENQRVMSFDKEKMSCRNYGSIQFNIFRNSRENTYYFRNVFEELDCEGEFFIDRADGKLYIYPYEISDVNDVIYVSTNSNSIINADNLKNIVINGIIFKNGAGDGIRFDNSKNCVVQNCDFINLNTGVYIYLCSNTGVTTSYFKSNKKAVYAWNRDTEGLRSYTNAINSDMPRNIFAQNNFIDGNDGILGRDNKITLSSGGTVTSHNLGVDATHGSFGLGEHRWEFLEYNEAVGACKIQNDGGELYTGGVTAAHQIVRYNYFHKPSLEHIGRSLYFDEGGGNFTVYGNVSEGHDMGTYAHGGKGGVYYNNIFYNNNSNINIGEHRHSTYLRERETIFNVAWEGWWAPHNARWSDVYTRDWVSSFPEDVVYADNIENWKEEYPTLGDEIGKYEDWCLTPNGYFIKNNVYVGGVDKIYDMTKQNSEVYDSVEGKDKSIFKDIDNHDYTIVDEEVLNQLGEEFEQIPMDKIGLIRSGTRWEDFAMEKIKKPTYPKSGYENRVPHTDINFDWLKVKGASYYRIEIAEDINFENIVYDEEVMYSNTKITLEPQKHYYYRITAKSYAKSLDNAMSTSDVYDFYTYTLEEANAAAKGNKTFINLAIGKAAMLMEAVKEGDGAGEYPNGTKLFLQEIINNATRFAQENNIQNLLDAKEQEIYNSIFEVQNTVNPSVTKPDFSVDNWTQITSATQAAGDITKTTVNAEEDGSTKLTTTGTMSYMQCNTKIPYGSFATFRVKTDTLESWQVYSLVFSKPAHGLTSNDAYSIVLSTDSATKKPSIELQKYHASTNSQPEFLTVENDGIVVPGEWVEVAMGALPAENGTRFVCIMGDKVVYDYYDPYEKNCYYTDSYFVPMRPDKDSENYFMQSERTIDEIMNILNEKGE